MEKLLFLSVPDAFTLLDRLEDTPSWLFLVRAPVWIPMPPPVTLATKGEQYTATYQAVGAVTLAVMSADDFYAYTDRAIANKSMTGGSEVYPG